MFDWRDRAIYNYTMGFTDRDWAWEGLRRNPEYRSAWHRAYQGFDLEQSEPDVTIVKVTGFSADLDRWGVLYSESPQLDARDASVLWRDDGTEVLHAVALSEIAHERLGVFQLGNVSCRTVLLTEPNGLQYILFRGQDCQLQLRVSGATVLKPVHLLAGVVLNERDLRRQSRTRAIFNDLRTKGRSELFNIVPKDRGDRLRLVVQALDGFLQDASLREIGAALFGAERVARDWDDDHRHLKDRVRRAVARGRWLMEGGYKNYLK